MSLQANEYTVPMSRLTSHQRVFSEYHTLLVSNPSGATGLDYKGIITHEA
jgi:hypothetical protein